MNLWTSSHTHTLSCSFQCEVISVSAHIALYSCSWNCTPMIGNVWVVMSCVTWSCEKIQTFFFRALWRNTAHVQLIRCSPKGSQRINWTSAVFSHIELKWTPSAYLHNIHQIHPWLPAIFTLCAVVFTMRRRKYKRCSFSLCYWKIQHWFTKFDVHSHLIYWTRVVFSTTTSHRALFSNWSWNY